MSIQIKFINEENKDKYAEKVLTWLRTDFFERDNEPKKHFWHNRRAIKEAFNHSDAMVVLNDRKEIIAYMIWTFCGGGRAEIDIVEVRKEYRQQGIFKKCYLLLLTGFPMSRYCLRFRFRKQSVFFVIWVGKAHTVLINKSDILK